MTERRKNCKYAPWMCEEVIKIAQEGGFHAAMMLKLGISRSVFYEYKKNIPEFKEAVEEADLINLARQEKIMSDAAEGKIKNYNYNSNAFILYNKYKEDYQKDGSPTSITINNVQLTSEQRDYKIAQISEKLKAMGVDLFSLPDLTTKIIDVKEEIDDNQ